jgi:hypothetical protein
MHYQKKIKCNTCTKISLINYYVLSFFLILNSYFLLTSCSDPSSNNKVTFSGTVTLAPEGVPDGKDTTDYSGVTVSLYEPVELDPSIGRTGTALVRINQHYPNIGVQI